MGLGFLESYRSFLKGISEGNLLVNLVGDFAGGDLLRGSWEVKVRVVVHGGCLLERGDELLCFGWVFERCRWLLLSLSEHRRVHEAGRVHLIVLSLLLFFLILFF